MADILGRLFQFSGSKSASFDYSNGCQIGAEASVLKTSSQGLMESDTMLLRQIVVQAQALVGQLRGHHLDQEKSQTNYHHGMIRP